MNLHKIYLRTEPIDIFSAPKSEKSRKMSSNSQLKSGQAATPQNPRHALGEGGGKPNDLIFRAKPEHPWVGLAVLTYPSSVSKTFHSCTMANRGSSKRAIIIGLVIGAIVLFVVAFFIGFFSAPGKTCETGDQVTAGKRKAEAKVKSDFHEKLYNSVDAAQIGKNLRWVVENFGI